MARKGKGRTGGKAARNGADTAFGTIRISRANGVPALGAVVAIALGYVLLARGSTVAAPLLLVLGYVVLTPLAIMR